MKDFFNYLTVSEEDKNWGLYLNVAGKSQIPSRSTYPSPEHPSGYFFSWNSGRVLMEYQLNYITSGRGFLENEYGKFPVREGTLMIIRRGIWHRYRPNKNTGWTENYIGFSGPQADHFFNSSPILKGHSIINCGIREDLIDLYYKVFELSQKEEPGYQQIASGLLIQLLGNIVAFKKQLNFSGKDIEKTIQHIRYKIRDNVENELDLHGLAAEHHIGYSYFRKMFKQYTGVSPRQYHLDLKIMRAKELLLSTDKSIKEISFELGFQSSHYFSRYFTKKTGLTPSACKKARNNLPDDLR